MKKILFTLMMSVAVLIGVCQTNSLQKMYWISGNWVRVNCRPGLSGTESWSKLTNDEMVGKAITLRGIDTIELEKLKIVKKGSDYFYVADLKANKQPVYFKMTKITDDEFVCENSAHDFPKMIVYKKEGDKMKATISGNGKAIDYMFEKKE